MTFDHLVAGPDARDWDALVADVPRTVPPAGGHLVVLAAHPDDETLGAGGLMALTARNGARITVLVASDGDASHPDSPTHRPDALAARRRHEVAAAVAAVAPDARLVLLGLPDGRLSEHAAALTTALRETAADATHLVAPWGGDRHPDHEACARAARTHADATGAPLWHYPLWAWHWDDPAASVLSGQNLVGTALDAGAQDAKARALACHVSQHRPLSDAPGDEAILPASLLAAAARPVEVFVVAADRPATPVGYFADLYAADPDPWGLAGRFYEQRKRAVLLAALPRVRFRRAFEPGCATGALTVELARRCDEVVAWDAVAAAVATASAAVDDSMDDSVTVELRGIPDDWPAGRFDLIVLSEVGYYCADLGLLAARVEGALDADGVLVACHWRRPAAEHVHTAEAVHDAVGGRLRPVVHHVEDDFVLQVWSRTGTSVAVADGIVG